jgi:hypothetical protein
MDGLEAIAGVGQGAPDDNRHGVVEIGAAHLLFDIDRNEVGAAGRKTAVERELGVLIVCHRIFQARRRAAKKVPVEEGPGSADCNSILRPGRGFQQGEQSYINPYFSCIYRRV